MEASERPSASSALDSARVAVAPISFSRLDLSLLAAPNNAEPAAPHNPTRYAGGSAAPVDKSDTAVMITTTTTTAPHRVVSLAQERRLGLTPGGPISTPWGDRGTA